MRRAAKVKVAAVRIPLRKSAARHAFPAWIDATERGVGFAAKKTVMPRVRDGLVLRVVSKKLSARTRSSSDGPGAR
jgi:hypothetical protein